MFIKWRVYQRQKKGIKADKYYLQPVLVMPYRAGKKRFRSWAIKEGISQEEFEATWDERKNELNSPRHRQLYRFKSFPSCDYVYYEDPSHIENRLMYWEYLDLMLEHSPIFEGATAREKQRTRDEIESILPRPGGYLLDILEKAYQAGMPKAQSPKEQFERENVVSHDMGLQNGE